MDSNERQSVIGLEEELEINLYDLFYLFRQKLVGIILATLLGGMIVGLFTYFFIAPKYEATAKLYIVSASNDSVVNLADLQIGASLTADYEELVLSRPMLESVIRNLELDVEGIEELEEMITISNPGDTRILNITATSTDPQEAEQIANEMARLAVDWLPAVMESNTPNIAEEAVIPEKKASPSYTVNTLIGALAFFVLYFGFEVICFLHDDTIRSAEEFERYFGIVPLAAVPEEKMPYAEKSGSSKGRVAVSSRFKKKGGRQA